MPPRRSFLGRLKEIAPQIPVIAEEEVAAGRVPSVGREFFLVDPLDGTKEFIQKRGDFTVNIALIRERSPLLGVVYAPAKSSLFAGNVSARYAFRSDQNTDDTAAGAATCHRSSAGTEDRRHSRQFPVPFNSRNRRLPRACATCQIGYRLARR